MSLKSTTLTIVPLVKTQNPKPKTPQPKPKNKKTKNRIITLKNLCNEHHIQKNNHPQRTGGKKKKTT